MSSGFELYPRWVPLYPLKCLVAIQFRCRCKEGKLSDKAQKITLSLVSQCREGFGQISTAVCLSGLGFIITITLLSTIYRRDIKSTGTLRHILRILQTTTLDNQSL